MSNSILHHEKRLARSKQKQYENRMMKNASRRNVPYTRDDYHSPLTVTTVKKKSWWQRLLELLDKVFRRGNDSQDERGNQVWRASHEKRETHIH